MFKVDDAVRCTYSTVPYLTIGNIYIVKGHTSSRLMIEDDRCLSNTGYYVDVYDSKDFKIELVKETNMIKEIGSDVKGFVKDNRQVIYWVAMLLLVDHFVFNGQFKTKLQDLVSKLIGKVERQVTKED